MQCQLESLSFQQTIGELLRRRNGPIKDPKAKAASTLQKSEALSTERVVGVLYGTKGLLGEGIGQRVETMALLVWAGLSKS